MSAVVTDYARAVKLPKAAKRTRLCQYAGPFCGFCPDQETLPCVLAGGYWDCETCAASGCPCMKLPTTKRRAVYQEWKERHDAANALTAERKRRYRPRRYRNAAQDKSKHYSLGRICVHPECDKLITNKNVSGLCKSCVRLRRKA